jgi:signal transduction histidine kinase/DNA-binding response OmpR family regulator
MRAGILSKGFNVIYLLIFLLIEIPFNNYAQPNSSLDSMKFVLTKARNTVDSANVFNQIVWDNCNLDTNLAFEYSMKSFRLISRIKDKEKLAETYDAVAWGYRIKGNSFKAKEYYNLALTLGNKFNFLNRIAWGNYNFACMYRDENRQDDIYSYALKARSAFKQSNNIRMSIYSDWLIIKAKGNNKTDFVDSTINDYKIAEGLTRDPNILLDEYLNLIYLYQMKENRTQSMIYAMKALDIGEKIKNEKAIFKAYYQIADYLRDFQHNYEIALLYYTKILDILKKKNAEQGITGALDDIGITYKLMGNDSLALRSFNESLELGKKINHKHSIASAYRYLGEISFLHNKFEKALKYYMECYETGCDICPKIAFHQVLVDIGKVYLKKNDFPDALIYFNKSLFLADSSNAAYERAVSYSALGDYYLQIRNNSSSIMQYLNAFKITSSSNSLSLRKEITSKLSEVYKDQNNFAQAYEYLNLSKIISDSLNKMNEAENLSRLETKFEFQNFQQQKENELKESQIKSNAEIDRQSQLKYFFIIGFLLAAGLGLVIYTGFRRKKQDNEILELQKMQIEEMSSKVHKADQKKLSFFTNISHELRTPLTLILGPVEKLITGNSLSDSGRPLLSMVRRNTLHLYNLINQLLDIHKLDTGNIKLKLSKGELVSYCRGIYSTFCHLAEENKINFHFSTQAENLSGWFDRDIIEKILNNLLSNAFKYTPQNGEINIALSASSYIEKEPSLIKISVSDNGKGIPEDQIQYVFDRFYQVENSNTGFNTGTGIGLAYTKELIELHKGKINVDSRLNLGTTFTVTLPIDGSFYSDFEKSTVELESGKTDTIEIRQKYLEQLIALENEKVSIQDDSGSADENKIMLIVDDNSDMRRFIKTIFEDEYSILEAQDGNTGLDKASKFVPDIIISDVMMPGMNGLELCSKLKSNIQTNHIPILILTAKTGEENEIEGLKTGVDDYITKPFNSEILEMKVSGLLASREKLKEYFKREFLLKPHEVKLFSPEDEFLRKAVKIVEDNISNPDLNVEMLMKELGVSRTQLFRKLKAITNYSANQFVRNIKLKRAAQLLQQRTNNITEVLYLSGFNSPSYFTSCFKEMYGCLPKDYQAKSENSTVLVN